MKDNRNPLGEPGTAPIESKYYLKHLDCASCAAKIENRLALEPGVAAAVIDFANLMLRVQADGSVDIARAVAAAAPEVTVTPVAEAQSGEAIAAEPHWTADRGIQCLVLALILFIPILFFEDRLHANLFLEWGLVGAAYLLAGWNVLRNAWRTVRSGQLFDENVLMVIATAGAMAIHAVGEAVGVMLFYKVGELLQARAVGRSRRSVKALLASRPDVAFLATKEGLRQVLPETLVPGDIIAVRPGDRVPVDGTVTDGDSFLDSSALTGESVPVAVGPGGAVLAGQINTRQALTVTVRRPFAESAMARMMDLVENASARKARTETFMTSFARYYTPAVVAIAAAVALVPPLVSADARFADWFYRALVILVISCPCALVVSVPLGYFGGIGRASKQGILIKGSNFIEALARVRAVVFDKTGTLTRGVFQVNAVTPAGEWSDVDLIRMAAAAEYHSAHPIADAIGQAAATRGVSPDPDAIGGHLAIAGKGVEAEYAGRVVLAGSAAFLAGAGANPVAASGTTDTAVHVAVDGVYAGHIAVGDQLRHGAADAVAALHRIGVRLVAMLTGDHRPAAVAVAAALGIDSVHADLLPEDKVNHFEQIRSESRDTGTVAYVGDGINDAPVLAGADVGIAMGGAGSDAAIESADVVLMSDAPGKVVEAIAIARLTRTVVWQNIFLALIVKGVVVCLGAMGMAGMWAAVFADMGTALVAIFNAARIIHSGPDGTASQGDGNAG